MLKSTKNTREKLSSNVSVETKWAVSCKNHFLSIKLHHQLYHRVEGHISSWTAPSLVSLASWPWVDENFLQCSCTLRGCHSEKENIFRVKQLTRRSGLSWVTRLQFWWVTLLLSFSNVFSLVLWAPQAQFHLIPLYVRDGRNHYCWYLQNWTTHTIESRQRNCTTGKRKNKYFDFGVNCPFKSWVFMLYGHKLLQSVIFT